TVGSMVFTVRTAGDPLSLVPAIRGVVRDLDSDVPVHDVELLSHAFGRRLSSRRFSMSLLSMFAGLAILLGAVGIYGVMSYSVTQRTRELGVRIALGAYRSDVVRMVLRQGVVTAAVGVVLGIGAGLASGRVLESQLYGVQTTDPLTYTGVAMGLLVVAIVASWIPARRASSVDPLEALRQE
ncbi:MAG TPA: FtsX-like permease family protein, partial [Longimicrobiales bacterium]|nr:FtsX-like permease family protein [Longimicrobiales bacterium]